MEGQIKYDGQKIAIIVGRFNDEIGDKLLAGALHVLGKYDVPEENLKIVKVPGAFEIPLTAQKLARTGEYGAIITLGVIVKGDTEHYTYVCKETADGIMRVQLDEGVPIVFEVLMVERADLAEIRANTEDWTKNKGYVAGLNALEMMNLYSKISEK